MTLIPRIQRHILLFTFLLAACAAPIPAKAGSAPDAPSGQTRELAEAPPPVAPSSEIRVRGEGITFWIRTTLATRVSAGQTRFVIQGRASRALTSVFSSVPDDAFGTARLTGARRFEVELDAHETHTLIFGLPLRISVVAEGAPHPSYVLAVRGASRLTRLEGAPAVWLVPELTPVYVNREVVHRGLVYVARGYHSLGIEAGAGLRPAIVPRGGGAFAFTWSYDQLASIASRRTPIHVIARGRAGEARKSAQLRFGIEEVEVTHEDPNVTWAYATCEPEVLTCLRETGMEGDTSPCGDAFAVTRCFGEIQER